MGESLLDRLKRAREEAGLNQESLAKLAGVTQSAYRSAESGKTKKGRICRKLPRRWVPALTG
ncbi:helix-turn-helix transcriptional regulator [Microbulbifer harenosus]|uniref:helix-turn-helix transcriptional regulator n=1 Tax=Microbulbifer harenosus TaxID=2576840 RepID=UPI001484E695